MRVYLTGGVRIETDTAVVNHRAFDLPHAQLVIAYLVCERGRPVARSEIADLLTHCGSLSLGADVLLARLTDSFRALVPGSEITCALETVELAIPIETWVDIEAAADALHEAEAALRADRPGDAFGPSAIAHHIARRPFLPGECGPWVETHRERLRGILVRALEARGKVFLCNNEAVLAIEAAREVVKLEPYRETGYQLLVRALAASGNTAEALRAGDRCRQVLREGLGIEPSAETQRLFGSLAPPRVPLGRTPAIRDDLAPTQDASNRRIDLLALLKQELGNEYVIERELIGGMSKVFVAMERALGRRVAIKVLPPAMVDQTAAQRFAREVQLTARLQHPNVVPVLSSGVLDGLLPYYTMPFVAGESLRSTLSAVARIAPARVISILRDVARALAFAHSQGIIHRDIKPENILLSGDSAVVTDFGIAKAINDISHTTGFRSDQALTHTGTAVGTPYYMAPEQILGDPSMDHRVDIYSFGVVAYELLAGRLPFADRGIRERLAAQLTEKPDSIDLVRGDVPAALSATVMQCLATDAAARPQSMQDVIGQLGAGGSETTKSIAR